MPQFDQFSFFNQVYWLLFIFFNFYFFISYFFLPKIVSQIKFRKKKINLNQQLNNIILFEKEQKQLQLSQSFLFYFNNLTTYLKKTSFFHKKKQTDLKNQIPTPLIEKIQQNLNQNLIKSQQKF